VKRAAAKSLGPQPIRRLWLAQLLLIVYVAAVHGLPALHLGWHKNDHVHELGGLRWLSRPLPVHTHAHVGGHLAADDAADDAHASSPDDHNSRPRLRPAIDASAQLGPQHLALGPSHGQQSLIAPTADVVLAAALPAQLLAARTLLPSSKEVLAKPRARAPPSCS
jgi:hypothetical protein